MTNLQDDELLESMSAAGIPARFQSKAVTIKDATSNKELIELARNRSALREAVRSLDAVALIGEERRVPYLFARALLFAGIGVTCTTSNRLSEMIETRNAEQLADSISDKTLCVLDFHNKKWTEFPLGPPAAFRLELFLKRYVENGGVLILDLDTQLAGVTWWSKRFVSSLNNTREFQV